MQCSGKVHERATDGRSTVRQASTHWLRHTFTHQLPNETEGDLALLRAVPGHKSISRTAIYVKADLEARVRGVKKAPR